MTNLNVSLAERSYTIHISKGALKEAPLNEKISSKKAALVTDENVWRLHGPAINSRLKSLGIEYSLHCFPAGEQSKSLGSLNRLYSELFAAGMQRSDTILAFGGGVIGDLAGFAAATYMRGIPFIQIPTTLLSLVDSSVGGKTAVNLPNGKNIVGSFYQPAMVIADTLFLETLPEREFKAGMGEVIKYAAIEGGKLLDELQTSEAVANSHANIEQIIYLCCKSKAGFVERDERDTSVRMFLNFGHTFGHAIEEYYSYEKYSHGEAVAIGCILAARAGELAGITAPGTLQIIEGMMQKAGLSYSFAATVADIAPLMLADKKNSGSEISLVLLKKIGEPMAYKIGQKALEALFAEDQL